MLCRFHVTYLISLIFAIFIIAHAYRLNNLRTGFIICSDEQHWKIEQPPGKAFEMFHIILILIGAIQAERVFYSVPHHMGYFEKVDPDEYDIFVSSNEFYEDIGQSEIFIFGQKN